MKYRASPTARAGTLFVAALVLYFFANQTQVGWLYLMSAVMAGAVAGAALLNRGALRGLSGERRVERATPGATPAALDEALYEGDTAAVSLIVRASRPAAQIALTERCPLAAPDAPEREQSVYIPALGRGGSVELVYEVVIDRRGVYRFEALAVESRAPFGVFRRWGQFAAPAAVLVYPEVRTLRRFDLLDRAHSAQTARPTAGAGGEVIGARPYRPGDSPRHIHWRGSARRGQLISKEFADETQPALLLALDAFAHAYPAYPDKHTPFEYAVKIAAAIGEYAFKRGYSVLSTQYSALGTQPVGSNTEHRAPSTQNFPVSRTALLELLAKVQPIGTRPLAEGLAQAAGQAFAAVILPYPDRALIPALAALRARGTRMLAVTLDLASFPHADFTGELPDAAAFAAALNAAGVETRLVRYGDDWPEMLSPSGSGRAVGVPPLKAVVS